MKPIRLLPNGKAVPAMIQNFEAALCIGKANASIIKHWCSCGSISGVIAVKYYKLIFFFYRYINSITADTIIADIFKRIFGKTN